MPFKFSKETELEIIEDLKIYSHSDTSLKYNITKKTLHNILKRNKIPIGFYKKSRVNLSKTDLDIDYFKYIDTHEKAYWLGFIAADGHITKSNNKLSLVSKDLEIIEKFKRSISSKHKISDIKKFDKRTNKVYQSYTIQIGNELFVNNLNKHGINNNKSNIFDFPEIDSAFKYSFISGLFDGDGSVGRVGKHKDRLRVSLISSIECINKIHEFLFEYGINKISTQRVSENVPNVWKMHLYKDSIIFLDLIYGQSEDMYLSRKYNIYKEYKNGKN